MQMRPRDHNGRFVPIDCPNPACGYGTLQYEGHGIWQCDGLADPGSVDKDLECCPFTHIDGEPYSTQR